MHYNIGVDRLFRGSEETSVLFSSQDHLVKGSLFEGETVFVTFQSATRAPGLHRSGFGEEFFRKRQISAVHVVPAASAWYQHSEIFAVCEAVKRTTTSYKHVVTYGSSMGGYAALNFAHLVGATDVIAISAQYTIDPDRAPDDFRYRAATKRMQGGFVYDQPAGRNWSGMRVNLLYDPFDPLDAYQADLAEQDAPIQRVGLNHSTHPVTAVLGNQSLKDFVLSYASDPDAAVAAVKTAYKADRANSWHYWMSLARRYGRTPRRLLCAEQAAKLNPAHPHPHLLVGKILLMHGRHNEAVKAFNKALMANPRMPEPFIGKAKAFIELGSLDRARAAIEEARKRNASPHSIGTLEVRLKRAISVHAP